MRLAERDTSPGAYAVTVTCIHCGRRRRLADVIADLDGPPFYAYHCFEHPPTETGAAADYAREGWQQTPTGWKSTRSTP